MNDSNYKMRLFGFPFRIDVSFWILSVVLGYNLRDPLLIAIWVGIVLFSVSLHELGHAFMGKAFGLDPSIELYSMGGLTHWKSGRRLKPSQSILVSLAGPGAGFIFGALLWIMQGTLGLRYGYAGFAMRQLLWVNIGWGLLNLVPMLPLDGGNIMRSIIHSIQKSSNDRLPLMISIGFGVLGLALALLNQMFWAAYMCGWFAYNNYNALQQSGVARGMPSAWGRKD